MTPTFSDTRPWITENSTANVLATALGALVLGIPVTAMGWMLRNAPGQDGWVAIGMMIVGALMAIGGLAMLVAFPKQITTVDPVGKRIRITTQSRFGSKEHTVRFSQIERLTTASAGDNEGGTRTFHVEAALIDGSTLPLFAHHYAGTKDRDVAEERKQRLAAMILAAYPGKSATLLPPQRSLMDRLLRR